MMISPETYYEDNLKGKSAGEILREIQSLKREINRLIISMICWSFWELIIKMNLMTMGTKDKTN